MPFLKRSLSNLVTLLAILIGTFFLLHTLPGGPFDTEKQLPKVIQANLYEKYGLHPKGDDSFLVWLGKDLGAYFKYLPQGRLGPSLTFIDQDVSAIILQALPVSFELGLWALLVSVMVGCLMGILSARFQNRWFDSSLQSLATLLISWPSFIFAVGVIFVFSIYLKLLPPALWEGPNFRILPVLTLSLYPTAYLAIFTRHVLIDQLKSDYIRTARAKGLTFMQAIVSHAFKNASPPVLTLLGPLTAHLITGSFVVEIIFSIPGLGRHFVSAITNRDYFLVMGITLVYSTILILLNWIVDLLYVWLDPRLKAHE